MTNRNIQDTPRKHKAELLTNLESLPDSCAVYHITTKKPVILMAGEIGYYPADDLFDAERVKAYNRVHKADACCIAAMEAGSMFGWHIPLANPALHRNTPNLKKGAEVKFGSIAWDGGL